jgi:hypothetical protein
MLAVPAATPLTIPVTAFTVATVGFELDHTTVRPLNGVPLASFVTALACVVAPTTTLDAAKLTVTVATGTTGAPVTVTVARPVFPSLVATILAVPAATPVTTPVNALTVATPWLADVHVTEQRPRTLPRQSSTVA